MNAMIIAETLKKELEGEEYASEEMRAFHAKWIAFLEEELEKASN